LDVDVVFRPAQRMQMWILLPAQRMQPDTFAGVVYGFDLRSIGWFLSIFVRF
jgi:hypothetical protein